MKQNKSETRLVYSSDGSHLKLCKKCGEDPCECADSPIHIVTIDPVKTTLKIKLEKKPTRWKISHRHS